MTEWVTLGTDRISDAQRSSGLSDERAARQVPVATRTWIRWKKRGQVPLHLLDRVAEILALEIERPTFDSRVVVESPALGVEERLARVEGLLLALDRKLDTDVIPRLDRLADDQRSRTREGV